MKNGDAMRSIRFFVFVLICLPVANAFSQDASSLIDVLQAERQRVGTDAHINLQQFSRDTQAIATQAYALSQSGENRQALDKLLELNKYAPLDRYPDYTVQVVCFNIYTDLANERDATACRRRAAAMAVILLKLSGSGKAPDDPIRIVRVGEIGDWLRMRSAKMSDVQAIRHQGSSLQKVTFTTPADSHAEVAYFLMNPREVSEIDQSAQDVFQPLPVSDNDGKYAAAMKEAHERRAKFLSDQRFNYRELIQLVQDSQKAAMQLAQQGDVAGALSKIREVERIRPIRDIPIFSLVSNYSALLGKAGNEGAHADMRLYLFGIAQDIAHSGDGLTPETAVRVIAVNEEYSWLSAKKLHVTRQALIRNGDSQYDAIEATDASGRSRTYYFDVTPFFGRYVPVANKR
ncbi:TPA: DUF4919 domain-containing protein [Burkholderia cenocepacia]|uniref:DUF4919 domain-containing protein n=1 Tax=Burkholderia sp. BCC0801 TaxID=2676291 RepID=UPI00158BF067|nr:DUF4919 domain-containing protein [Burkholderia sp. BCC0801]HEF5869765.1 DUF4919 domain-containing protein [Burkholderia cenocepacia]